MNNYENTECESLCAKYKLRIEDANFAKGLIPRKILLDHTRNIHSYIVTCKLSDNILQSIYWNKDTFEYSLKKMLAIQNSNLDRPLFFVYKINANEYKTIEGNEIREALLENPLLNPTNFILNNSYTLDEIINQIHKEL